MVNSTIKQQQQKCIIQCADDQAANEERIEGVVCERQL